MGAKILRGDLIAGRILSALGARAAALERKRGYPPALAILRIGDNPASRAYARNQIRIYESRGISVRVAELGSKSTERAALKVLDRLTGDPRVDGVIVHTPLPPAVRFDALIARLPPEKDVEGLTLRNYGMLYYAKTLQELKSKDVFVPPTAQAILMLLRASGTKLAGAAAVVVGRSGIVGRPAAHLLSCANATVTLCHSKTANLARYLRQADIVVCAAGRPRSIKGSDLKKGCTVIDAGTSYVGAKLRGDADAESVRKAARAIAPVPGGVGPLTTAMLLANLLNAAERR